MLIESFMIFTMVLSVLPERIKIEKVKKLVVANFHSKKIIFYIHKFKFKVKTSINSWIST